MRWILLCLLVMCGSACAKLEQAQIARWVEERGGCTQDARLEAVSARLAPVTIPVRLCMLETHEVGAWAWKDGQVFVSRRLAQMLTDDELFAVVAHEMGHLAEDEKHAGSLIPKKDCPADEVTADAYAARELARQGLPAKVLATALTKVRDAQGPRVDPVPLNRRIALLSR